MKKEWLVKTLALGVVVLFIGINFQSILAKDAASSKKKSDVVKIDDEKDLLFGTIVDIANKKEIQKIIKNSYKKEIYEKSIKNSLRSLMLDLRIDFLLMSPPPQVLTKDYLQHVYKANIKHFKNFDEFRFAPIIENLQVYNQEIQKEINLVIEKNATL